MCRRTLFMGILAAIAVAIAYVCIPVAGAEFEETGKGTATVTIHVPEAPQPVLAPALPPVPVAQTPVQHHAVVVTPERQDKAAPVQPQPHVEISAPAADPPVPKQPPVAPVSPPQTTADQTDSSTTDTSSADTSSTDTSTKEGADHAPEAPAPAP